MARVGRIACVLLLASMIIGRAHGKPEREDAPDPREYKAAILSLQGEITDVMYESLHRRFEQARADEVDVIVLDIDTPGGLVTSSIAIADLIKNQTDIKTVAWVNPNAHSGGTIVAVACNEIVMAQSSRMGDSQVIMGGPGGAEAVPEDLQAKAYTPVLTEFRASARLRGYDQVLCEAFVIPDREVWWLENTETGQREFVFREEKIKRLGEEDRAAKSVDDGKDADAGDDGDDADKKADRKNTDGAATKSAAVAEPTEPTERAETGAKSPWKLVEKYYDPLLEIEVDCLQPIVPDSQLLEMSAGEAFAYGFSKGIVRNEEELKAQYGLSHVVRLAPTWSEALAYWLTSMYVRGFLMMIIMLGAYVEFHTPGVGVPGLVALIALSIFVGAPFLAGFANVWELVMIAVGIGLIVLEVFVIPGFGLAGIAGVFLLFVGLLATFVPDEPGRSFPIYYPSFPSTIAWLKTGILTMASSAVASIVGMVLLSKYLPRTLLFSRFAPANPTPSEVAFGDAYRGAARVGDIGLAEGPLHPAGKARFGRVLVDVVSQGDFLDGGITVEVIERRGNRVVVRPSGAAPTAETRDT